MVSGLVSRTEIAGQRSGIKRIHMTLGNFNDGHTASCPRGIKLLFNTFSVRLQPQVVDDPGVRFKP
jgi:hypothetical protein